MSITKMCASLRRTINYMSVSLYNAWILSYSGRYNKCCRGLETPLDLVLALSREQLKIDQYVNYKNVCLVEGTNLLIEYFTLRCLDLELLWLI